MVSETPKEGPIWHSSPSLRCQTVRECCFVAAWLCCGSGATHREEPGATGWAAGVEVALGLTLPRVVKLNLEVV